MESSNPVLSRYGRSGRGYAAMGNGRYSAPTADQELEQLYNAPAASSIRTGRMTMDDVVTRTGMLFGILLVAGALSWRANLGGGAIMGSLIPIKICAGLSNQLERVESKRSGMPIS